MLESCPIIYPRHNPNLFSDGNSSVRVFVCIECVCVSFDMPPYRMCVCTVCVCCVCVLCVCVCCVCITLWATLSQAAYEQSDQSDLSAQAHPSCPLFLSFQIADRREIYMTASGIVMRKIIIKGDSHNSGDWI